MSGRATVRRELQAVHADAGRQTMGQRGLQQGVQIKGPPGQPNRPRAVMAYEQGGQARELQPRRLQQTTGQGVQIGHCRYGQCQTAHVAT